MTNLERGSVLPRNADGTTPQGVAQVPPAPLQVLEEEVPATFIAKEYLKQEFRKIFADLKGQQLWMLIDTSIDQIEDRLSRDYLWRLLAGISEGFRINWVSRILSNSAYAWNREVHQLSNITMTLMSPPINEVILGSRRDFVRFFEYCESHPEFTQKLKAGPIRPDPLRDRFPVMLRQVDAQLWVLDGMRRCILAGLRGNTSIEAYAGYTTTSPHDKMRLPPDKAYFLMLLFEESEAKSERLRTAILEVAKEIFRQYMDGEKILKDRVAARMDSRDVKQLMKLL